MSTHAHVKAHWISHELSQYDLDFGGRYFGRYARHILETTGGIPEDNDCSILKDIDLCSKSSGLQSSFSTASNACSDDVPKAHCNNGYCFRSSFSTASTTCSDGEDCTSSCSSTAPPIHRKLSYTVDNSHKYPGVTSYGSNSCDIISISDGDSGQGVEHDGYSITGQSSDTNSFEGSDLELDTNSPDETNAQEQNARKPADNPHFIAYAKNARGLNDGKLDELQEDMDNEPWDALLLSETFRPEAEENFDTEHGHRYLGSGWHKKRRGVGILLHKRWKKCIISFVAVNERICYVDLDVHKWKLRLIALYMPDHNYSNKHVEQVYMTLDTIIAEGIKHGRHYIIGGDFNAEVGKTTAHGDFQAVGKYGMSSSNSRGEWLQQWSNTHKLIISNTHFKKQPLHKYTHISSKGRKRQIDYILMSRALFRITSDAYSSVIPHLGSDHRAVKAIIAITRKRNKPYQPPPPNFTGWEPQDPQEFENQVQHHLQHDTPRASEDSNIITERLQQQCDNIEQALQRAATLCQQAKSTITSQVKADRTRLRVLIEQRKASRITKHSTTHVRDLSKAIQKELKAITRTKHRRAKHEQQVQHALAQGLSLKQLQQHKGTKRRHHINSMKDTGGNTHYTRQDVANVFADFYEDLYNCTGQRNYNGNNMPYIQEYAPFTVKEVKKEIHKLKKKKACLLHH